MPNLASQMRVAFSSMASNTGSSSPGELDDDLQHFGGRGLLLQRLAQFVEQAGVLDGDDGLGGEILDQLDLLVGEWPHLLAIDAKVADQLVVLEHRHQQDGAGAGELDERDHARVALAIGRVGREVDDMNDAARAAARGRAGQSCSGGRAGRGAGATKAGGVLCKATR